MTATAIDLDRVAIDVLAGQHGPIRIVLVDGLHSRELSTGDLPPGLRCDATHDLSPSVRLLLADGTILREAIHVVHVSTGAGPAEARLVLDIGVGAGIDLVESYVGSTGTTDASTVAHVAAGARITIHRVQDEAASTTHEGRLHLLQREGSRSDVTVLSHGAATSRLETVVELLEPTASTRVTGLLAPQPDARHDDVVTVIHAASRCTSDMIVRAVVPERAHTTSCSRAVVRHGTVGSVVHQRADNLLLHRTAQADSRPWLEIFADDVRADHGSATGRLDDDALFYLRSRGIPADEARAVLVGAFARTIVERVEPPSLRAHVGGWFGWEEDT